MMPAPGIPGTTGTGDTVNPYLYDPLVLLTATPATIWAVATIAERRHARDEEHRRELEAIDAWLHAIRATR